MGDYTLTHLLGTHEGFDCYTATQKHVRREVVITVLHPGADAAAQEAFSADARAKAAAQLAGTARMLGIASAGNMRYTAQEKPRGVPLSSLVSRGERLSPTQVCRIIIAAAALYEACAAAGVSAGGLHTDAVYLSRREVRFLSPAVAAETDERTAQRSLAAVLEPLLPQSGSGRGRVATLIQWLREGYEGAPLQWAQLAQTAETVIRQLHPFRVAMARTVAPQTAGVLQRHHNRTRLRGRLKAAAFVLFIGCCAAAGAYFSARSAPEKLPGSINGYRVCRHHGKLIYVSERPVSIGEYRRFLSAYAEMSYPEQLRINRGLPEGETDHTPAGWNDQCRRADDTAPVVGVSYRAAYAYANYAGGGVPTADVLATLRRCNAPDIQEWSATIRPADTVYKASQLVLDGRDTPVYEADPGAQTADRGFRIFLTNPPKHQSS